MTIHESAGTLGTSDRFSSLQGTHHQFRSAHSQFSENCLFPPMIMKHVRKML